MSCCKNTAQSLDFPCAFVGDTVPSRTIDTPSIDYPLKQVTCSFTRYGGSTPDLVLDSEDTGITIVSNTAGEWSIVVGPITKEQTTTLGAGTYDYRLRFIIDIDDDDADDDADDTSRTLLIGNLELK